MKHLKFFLLCLVFPALALAHGDEDHSKDGAPAAQATVSAQPRIESTTETFEVVGQLQNDKLSFLVDRFDTNEPVLNANVEVELNGQKANARFQADQGDYVVEDKALLTTLGKPGKHALVLTIAASNDADLLETTMVVADDAHTEDAEHTHGPSLNTAAVIGVVLTVLLAAIAIVLARRKSSTGT